MKKMILLLLLLAIPAVAQNLSGVYILSEGGFSSQTSKLSYYNAGMTNFTQSIFTPGNLGLYPDGMIYEDSKLYICEQGSWGGSGKVYQLDSSGTVLLSTNAGTNPYSIALANDKLYLTNGPANSVSVLSAKDLSKVDSIMVGVYPQEILADGNLVFVANTSVYGGAIDSTISVIDATGDSVLKSIVLKHGISSLAKAGNGYIFAGCSGDETSGMIYKINTSDFTKTDSFSIAGYGFARDLNYDESDGYLSFLASTNDIVKYNIATKKVSVIATPVTGSYFYGYALDTVSNFHFIVDAKDFSSQGSLSIYDNSASLINSFTTGIAPRRIAMRYGNNTTAVKNQNPDQLSFALDQNYPNPFNPTTTIKYSLPKVETLHATSVQLKIYNLLGQEITTLVNEQQPAGNYKVNFDGSNLASGIYLYKLQAGDFVSVKKLVLLK